MFNNITPKAYPFLTTSVAAIGFGIYTFVYLTPTVVKVIGIFLAFVGATTFHNFIKEAEKYPTPEEFEKHIWEVAYTSFVTAVFKSIQQLTLETFKRVAIGTL